MSSSNSNFEKQNQTGQNQESTGANTPVIVLTASSVIGDKVENRQGNTLGNIKDVMLNLKEGTIEYFILQSGGFLGIGEKLFAVPYQEFQIDTNNKIFILDRDEDYIKNAPGFDKNHWPETNAQYYWDIISYWNGTYEREPLAGQGNNVAYKKNSFNNDYITPGDPSPLSK
jgi:sporulation protein YlmC with PRC-barrel domain